MLVALAAAYVAMLPLLHATISSIGPKRVVLADVAFAGLLLAATTPHRSSLRPPSRGLVVVAVVVPVAIALAGLLAGAAAGLDLARVTYSMAVLLLFAHLRFSIGELDRIAWTWVITACLVCSAGLLAFVAVTLFGAPPNALAGATSPNLGPGVIRMASTTGANALALYLQPSIAMCLYLMVRTGGRSRRLWFVLALLLLSATLTLSRSLVGVLLVLALAAHAAPAQLPWLWKRRHPIGIATAILLTAAIGATGWGVFPLRDGRINARPNAYRVLHAAAIRMFAARPLTGVGPGEFGRRLGEYTTSEERSSAWPPVLLAVDYDPHSTWLGSAAECGLLGLAAWIGLYGFVARRLIDAPPAILPRLAACTLAGLALSGLAVDISHLKFVWCFLGLGLSARAAAQESSVAERAVALTAC
jgi:O-antigen ligase